MNPKFLVKATYLLFIGFGAFHLTRLVIALGSALLLNRFGKPSLVRETSKLHSSNPITLPMMWLRKQYHQRTRRTEKDLLSGVILEKNLEDQLREISYAVLNRKKHFAPAKNLMFFGPPGTGKTLFAKKLALQSGLEYAVMVGSDIAPLGPLAVRELNKMFDWAENQSKGIILFIDEADAFLRSRKSSEMSEYMRHTINSFLYRSGTPSDNVIIVLATNAPEQLDEAVHDRIDEIIGFGLPSVNERKTMLFHYLVKYCQPPQTQGEKLAFLWKHPRSIYTGKKLIRMEGVTTEIVQEIADKTEGFSGRELTKMVIAWHDAAFTLPEPILTPELMRKVLKKFHLQHELKQNWSREEAAMMEKMLFLDESKLLQEIAQRKPTP
jgi:ATPase family AAA domain-containing protein 3A/B